MRRTRVLPEDMSYTKMSLAKGLRRIEWSSMLSTKIGSTNTSLLSSRCEGYIGKSYVVTSHSESYFESEI